MTSIASPSARAFQTAISSATTKAEVSTALSHLEKATDLSPSEKVALAKTAYDGMAGKQLGFGVDTAFKGFIEAQGAPVGPRSSPTMARIGAVLANSAKSVADAMNDVQQTASRGKGGGVAAGGHAATLQKTLKAVSGELENVAGDLKQLASDIAKGRGEHITAGDVSMLDRRVGSAVDGLQTLLDTLKTGGKVSKDALSDLSKDLLRSSSMAENTKEIGAVKLAPQAVAQQAVSAGKGGGVNQPSPFTPAPAPTSTFSTLSPNATVRGRVSDQQLKFAEAKIGQWHNTSAVSDSDVRQVRQTLGELFQLPRGQYLTLGQAGGDSAMVSGHLIKGDVRDSAGSVVSKFTGDLNTGSLQLQAVSIGK